MRRLNSSLSGEFNPVILNTLLLVLSLLFIVSKSGFSQSSFPEFPPEDVTAAMDRDQMMWQLGVSFPQLPSKLQDPNAPQNAWPENPGNPEGNWTDSSGYLYTRSGFGLWNNYDESKTGNYTPINLLKMNNGSLIRTADEWWNKRRPEILQIVQQEVWGRIPADSLLPDVTFEVKSATFGNGDTAYIQKNINGIINTSRYPDIRNTPKLKATLRIPANADGPVPVMIVYGFSFFDPLEIYWQRISKHGWGVCIFYPTELQPDNGSGLTSYLIGLVNKGNWRKPDDWGTLAAWSWGVSRLIDYFETDPKADENAIGVTGHSRYGKGALVALAYEPRLAIGFPSEAGALGTSMIRRHWGQDLENISWDQEYHWAAGNFFKYMGPVKEGGYMPRKVERLTVDAHSLIALAAPSPVFVNSGTQDFWVDPHGIYLALKGATPVYELLGMKGLVMEDESPIPDNAYIVGNLGHRYHIGGHTDAPDWSAFFEFAKKYIRVDH